MTVLSKRARQLIESGVKLLPDNGAKAVWGKWSASHPVPRGSFRTQKDEPFPQDVLDAALTGLSMKMRDLNRQREAAREDDAYEYENDLSYAHLMAAELAKVKESES